LNPLKNSKGGLAKTDSTGSLGASGHSRRGDDGEPVPVTAKTPSQFFKEENRESHSPILMFKPGTTPTQSPSQNNGAMNSFNNNSAIDLMPVPQQTPSLPSHEIQQHIYASGPENLSPYTPRADSVTNSNSFSTSTRIAQANGSNYAQPQAETDVEPQGTVHNASTPSKPLDEWSVQEVADHFANDVILAKFASTVVEKDLDGIVLLNLSFQEMGDLGLSFGAKKKIQALVVQYSGLPEKK